MVERHQYRDDDKGVLKKRAMTEIDFHGAIPLRKAVAGRNARPANA
jgi:hypothetical protein